MSKKRLAEKLLTSLGFKDKKEDDSEHIDRNEKNLENVQKIKKLFLWRLFVNFSLIFHFFLSFQLFFNFQIFQFFEVQRARSDRAGRNRASTG